MDEQGRGRRRWLKWRIGVMMIAVATFATVFALSRPKPSRESLAVELASELLGQHQPGFDAAEYRADRITPTTDSRFWRVHFTKIGGSGEAEAEATVPDWRVQDGRRRFWQATPRRPWSPAAAVPTQGVPGQ